MNKTININLAGIIFHMDEPAYERFSTYLNKVKTALQDQEGGAEIIADIEARIAELFQERLTANNAEVVQLADVEFVISTLGQPEDFGDDQEQDKKSFRVNRRLYRNPDDSVIGGVAGGIGAYFGVDPVWIRILFVLMLIFGMGFLLYVVLWIAIPEAQTTAQKLQMRGEPININNIERSVKDELNSVKQRFNRFRDEHKGDANPLKRFFNLLMDILEAVIKVFVKFFGVIAGMIGVGLTLGLLVFIVTILAVGWDSNMVMNMNGNEMNFFHITQNTFDSGWSFWVLKIGMVFMALAPILALTSAMIGLLKIRGIRATPLLIMGGASFFIGLIMLIVAGTNVATQFQSSATEVEKVMVTGTTFDLKADLLEEEFDFIDIDGDRIFLENLNVTVKRTAGEQAYISLKHKAQGSNRIDARTRAKEFMYPVEQIGNTLLMSEYFTVPMEQKFRFQHLKVTLYLPDSATVYLDPSVKDIIYDIDNVYDMWDGHMLDHTWMMTSKGLICLDCDDVEDDDYWEYKLEEEVEAELDREAKRHELKIRIETLEEELEELDD